MIVKHPRAYSGLNTYLNCNNGYSDGAYGIYNYTMIEISNAVPNGVTVYQLGASFYDTTAWRGGLYVVEDLGSATYAARCAVTFGTNFNPVAGWNWFDLSAAYDIPASGNFYLGIFSQTNATINSNTSDSLNRARKTGAMVVDTEYAMTEQSGSTTYLVGMKYR